MGIVVRFHDARASADSRAARSASFSSVISDSPRLDAASTTLDQRSAGIESRDFIVRACESGIPMASANLAGPPKVSMTEENEFMTQSLHQVASEVNTARSVFVATICRMEPLRKRQGNRLKEARNAAGYDSARSAALENGWPEATYRAHEGGWRTIGQDDAETYIRAFRLRGARITAESVLFPNGKHSPQPEESEFQQGWDAAMQAVAAAASAGNIQSAPRPAGKKPPKKK